MENGNLVLSRRINESLKIGDDIIIQVISMNRTQVKLKITAPKSVHIIRSELMEESK